jgi:replicative DNA helicase
MATERTQLKSPPHSLDAEAALLGGLMSSPELMHDIIETIRTDAFYSERHKIIWNTLLDLFSKHLPIDPVSISTRLEEKKELESIGGISFLAEISGLAPSASNVRHYANIVLKKYMLRSLLNASKHIADLGYEEHLELDEILDRAEKKVFEVTNFTGTHKFVHLGSELQEFWERFDKLANNKDEMRGVPTGFKDLDNLISGFQKSDLIILAARPSVGKTSLALDMARNAALTHNVPVGIFSLEMSSQQLVDRMMSAESRVDGWKIRTGKGFSLENDLGSLQTAMERLSKAPLYIDDQPGNNILKMRAVARRLKADKGLGMIVVDYLQLMMPTQTRQSDNVVQQVTEISRSLKQLARELEVPVLALSQLSRAVEQRGGKPRLSDLRDSGSIEQDADLVMFIHREAAETAGRKNQAEILVEKHRNGPTGKVDLYFDDKRATYVSMEKSEFGDFDMAKSDF